MQNMNYNNIPIDKQNNIKVEQYNQNPSLNDYNNAISNINQDQAQSQIPYPIQELTNRNQFSDYDFRKKSRNSKRHEKTFIDNNNGK